MLGPDAVAEVRPRKSINSARCTDSICQIEKSVSGVISQKSLRKRMVNLLVWRNTKTIGVRVETQRGKFRMFISHCVIDALWVGRTSESSARCDPLVYTDS